VEIKRPHYVCKACAKYGYFDTAYKNSENTNGRLSPRLTEAVCLIAQQSSFETTSDFIQRLLSVKVSSSTVKEASENIGTVWFENELQSSKNYKPDIKGIFEQKIPENRCYLEMDGAMLRELKGFHENKLGVIFSESDMIQNGEGENARSTILKKTLVSSFKLGVDDFESRLKYWLIKTGTYFSKEIITISDGAIWIENIVGRLLPSGTHILDWFHAKEKLWECAKKIYGEHSPKVAPWVNTHAEKLWEGNIQDVLNSLLSEAAQAKNQTPLRELHNYYNHRKSMMRYAEFRKKGYCIGSGAIESANKYAIQDRLKRAGMKWTTEGANAIAKLRTTYLSGQWDTMWLTA